MPKDKRSFFERLTGSTSSRRDEARDAQQDESIMMETSPEESPDEDAEQYDEESSELTEEEAVPEPEEGQLTVDVYQTDTHIVIQAPMAGVKPDDVDVSITRDMITIKGKREHHREAQGDDYYYQELYWGSFARSILLPQEIDPDNAEATFKHGLLVVRLPKLDKNRMQRVKIKGD